MNVFHRCNSQPPIEVKTTLTEGGYEVTAIKRKRSTASMLHQTINATKDDLPHKHSALCSDGVPIKKGEVDFTTITSPQAFLTMTLQSRGYCRNEATFCSLRGGYHNQPTKHQISSYGLCLTKAIRSSDSETVRLLLKTGLSPNACNKFGESIIHAACRRGDSKMLRVLIESGSSVQVSDDYGRTPLHDACWTSSPNFETISLLLEQDPWLLCITDCRGSTPLSYVRKAHWALWLGFLVPVVNKYWPSMDDDVSSVDRSLFPPLACVEPNSRPLPMLKECKLTPDELELIASGKLHPNDLGKKSIAFEKSQLSHSDRKCISGITLDRMISNGKDDMQEPKCKKLNPPGLPKVEYKATGGITLERLSYSKPLMGQPYRRITVSLGSNMTLPVLCESFANPLELSLSGKAESREDEKECKELGLSEPKVMYKQTGGITLERLSCNKPPVGQNLRRCSTLPTSKEN